MAKTPTKKPAAPKGEVLSIRIDPRTKYGLELMARIQRRSVTGVVEWAILEAFKSETFDPGGRDADRLQLDEVLDSLWHINEVERIVALGTMREQLLTFDEARFWKVLRDTASFWSNPSNRNFNNFRWGQILPIWDDVIGPLVLKATQANIVRGLTPAELVAAGVSFPQTTGRAARPISPKDLVDDDIPF